LLGSHRLTRSGANVPADVRLVQVAEPQVDEPDLMGESTPVPKEVLPPPTPVTGRSNMCDTSTLVAHGRGNGVVVATGTEKELDEIHRLV
jgi:cation-transporting ATPase F